MQVGKFNGRPCTYYSGEKTTNMYILHDCITRTKNIHYCAILRNVFFLIYYKRGQKTIITTQLNEQNIYKNVLLKEEALVAYSTLPRSVSFNYYCSIGRVDKLTCKINHNDLVILGKNVHFLYYIKSNMLLKK